MKGLIALAIGMYLALIWVELTGQTVRPLPGDPLPGITSGEFEEFRLGLGDFTEVETVEDGLGPAFNGSSCAVCHSVPAIGGAGVVAEVRAARRNERGEFVELVPKSGSLFQTFSIPPHTCQPVIPPEANVIARRVPIPLFGAGLVEAILATLSESTVFCIGMATASAAVPRSSPTSPRAIAVSDVSDGRRSRRRCWRSAPTRTEMRWGLRTTCSPTRSRSASRPSR